MAGNRRWSQNDLDILKSKYGIVDVLVLAKELNRSVDAVHWKASKLEIKYDPTSVVNINMRLNNIEKTLKELVDLMQVSIHSSARWSIKEIKLLKQMYASGLSLDEISNKLNRAKPTIYNKLSMMKVKRTGRKRKLTPDVKKFIDENSGSMSRKAIAFEMNIAYSTVANYVSRQIKAGLLKKKYENEEQENEV